MSSILPVEMLTFTAEVQGIMQTLQEIHLAIRKYMFILQDLVEAVAIDCVVGRFVVYENVTFILMFLE